jgi:hypothetical protein
MKLLLAAALLTLIMAGVSSTGDASTVGYASHADAKARTCAQDKTSTYQTASGIHLGPAASRSIDTGRGGTVVTDGEIHSLPSGLSMQDVINSLGVPWGASTTAGYAYLWYLRAGRHPAAAGVWGLTFAHDDLTQRFISNR